MSAKARNLNFLKRFGYQTDYRFAENEVTITCHSDSDLPDLEIILDCRIALTRGKGGDYKRYFVEKAKIVNPAIDKESIFESNGEIIPDKKSPYLIPGKAMIDALLPILDKQGGYKDLWRIARKILRTNNEYITSFRAKEVLEDITSIRIIDGRISHPLIFNGSEGEVSFISREMLEYCLAYELNRQDPESQELRRYITSHTIKFLNFDQAIIEIFSPISDLKEKIVKMEEYGLAARLRDLEVNLVASYLSKAWPDLSSEEAQVFMLSRLKDL